MLTVVEVVESFATGTMEVVRTISAGLADRGHRVTIAFGRRPETPSSLREQVSADVDLFELPWTGRTPGAQVRAARDLRRLCVKLRPDVIHLHSSFAGFVGAFAVADLAPTIYTPHGYSFLLANSRASRFLYRLLERVLASRVTMVGAVSPYEAELARGVGACRVAVVPNGIPELDAPSGQPKPRAGRPVAVGMGRIVAARRPIDTARILRAVSDLADPEWIGGPGPDPRLEQELAESGVPATGWLTRESALDRLRGASLLVNWSAWDSHPLSVLEAMAADVPVLGSDIPANRDLLGPAQTRANEDDAIELARALLTEGAERERALANQRRRRGNFGAARMVDEWADLYSSLPHDGLRRGFRLRSPTHHVVD